MAALAVLVFALGAGSASATTFCVPSFHAACPNSGGNVAQASLAVAMVTEGDDGVADTIVMPPGPVTQADPYEILSGDNDDLEIIGDPLVATLPTEDFDGAPRPFDGDGDGDARCDMGAYEYGSPVPSDPSDPADPTDPTSPGGKTSDETAPQTKLVKGPGAKLTKGLANFKFRSSEAGSTFKCKLDNQKPKPCKSPRRYKNLKPGRHTFRVWATDAAGNKDKSPAKRRFRVPKP